jgi:hypothetical protein
MERHRALRRQRLNAYKVPLDTPAPADAGLTLHLYDEHDEESPLLTVLFSPDEISGRDSLHFDASEQNGIWSIKFHGDVHFQQIAVGSR